jgi:hypothetical protein
MIHKQCRAGIRLIDGAIDGIAKPRFAAAQQIDSFQEGLKVFAANQRRPRIGMGIQIASAISIPAGLGTEKAEYGSELKQRRIGRVKIRDLNNRELTESI